MLLLAVSGCAVNPALFERRGSSNFLNEAQQQHHRHQQEFQNMQQRQHNFMMQHQMNRMMMHH